MRSEALAMSLDEVSKRLLELKEHLDKLNIALETSHTKRCTKRCIEVGNIVGDIDAFFDKQ